MVFVGWCVVFYFGSGTDDYNDLLKLIVHHKILIKGTVIALPIGVMLHQLSVLIKNCIVGYIWPVFNDCPNNYLKKISLRGVDLDSGSAKYFLDHISNLNTFYYVRFDNGFLAPLLAWLFVAKGLNKDPKCSWVCAAIVICIVTCAYIPQIFKEMKSYERMLFRLIPCKKNGNKK
ncbi:MAG: hypothetical protein B6I36_09565 [Desulfobacteraceae bacterium 4572_35.1]|nr:MAG: hypothetical protein B6I36_09565 [Desulfobacteraceae bacterium 4572_35.1]